MFSSDRLLLILKNNWGNYNREISVFYTSVITLVVSGMMMMMMVIMMIMRQRRKKTRISVAVFF